MSVEKEENISITGDVPVSDNSSINTDTSSEQQDLSNGKSPVGSDQPESAVLNKQQDSEVDHENNRPNQENLPGTCEPIRLQSEDSPGPEAACQQKPMDLQVTSEVCRHEPNEDFDHHEVKRTTPENKPDEQEDSTRTGSVGPNESRSDDQKDSFETEPELSFHKPEVSPEEHKILRHKPEDPLGITKANWQKTDELPATHSDETNKPEQSLDEGSQESTNVSNPINYNDTRTRSPVCVSPSLVPQENANYHSPTTCSEGSQRDSHTPTQSSYPAQNESVKDIHLLVTPYDRNCAIQDPMNLATEEQHHSPQPEDLDTKVSNKLESSVSDQSHIVRDSGGTTMPVNYATRETSSKSGVTSSPSPSENSPTFDTCPDVNLKTASDESLLGNAPLTEPISSCPDAYPQSSTASIQTNKHVLSNESQLNDSLNRFGPEFKNSELAPYEAAHNGETASVIVRQSPEVMKSYEIKSGHCLSEDSLNNNELVSKGDKPFSVLANNETDPSFETDRAVDALQSSEKSSVDDIQLHSVKTLSDFHEAEYVTGKTSANQKHSNLYPSGEVCYGNEPGIVHSPVLSKQIDDNVIPEHQVSYMPEDDLHGMSGGRNVSPVGEENVQIDLSRGSSVAITSSGSTEAQSIVDSDSRFVSQVDLIDTMQEPIAQRISPNQVYTTKSDSSASPVLPDNRRIDILAEAASSLSLSQQQISEMKTDRAAPPDYEALAHLANAADTSSKLPQYVHTSSSTLPPCPPYEYPKAQQTMAKSGAQEMKFIETKTRHITNSENLKTHVMGGGQAIRTREIEASEEQQSRPQVSFPSETGAATVPIPALYCTTGNQVTLVDPVKLYQSGNVVGYMPYGSTSQQAVYSPTTTSAHSVTTSASATPAHAPVSYHLTPDEYKKLSNQASRLQPEVDKLHQVSEKRSEPTAPPTFSTIRAALASSSSAAAAAAAAATSMPSLIPVRDAVSPAPQQNSVYPVSYVPVSQAAHTRKPSSESQVPYTMTIHPHLVNVATSAEMFKVRAQKEEVCAVTSSSRQRQKSSQSVTVSHHNQANSYNTSLPMGYAPQVMQQKSDNAIRPELAQPQQQRSVSPYASYQDHDKLKVRLPSVSEVYPTTQAVNLRNPPSSSGAYNLTSSNVSTPPELYRNISSIAAADNKVPLPPISTFPTEHLTFPTLNNMPSRNQKNEDVSRVSPHMHLPVVEVPQKSPATPQILQTSQQSYTSPNDSRPNDIKMKIDEIRDHLGLSNTANFEEVFQVLISTVHKYLLLEDSVGKDVLDDLRVRLLQQEAVSLIGTRNIMETGGDVKIFMSEPFYMHCPCGKTRRPVQDPSNLLSSKLKLRCDSGHMHTMYIYQGRWVTESFQNKEKQEIHPKTPTPTPPAPPRHEQHPPQNHPQQPQQPSLHQLNQGHHNIVSDSIEAGMPMEHQAQLQVDQTGLYHSPVAVNQASEAGCYETITPATSPAPGPMMPQAAHGNGTMREEQYLSPPSPSKRHMSALESGIPGKIPKIDSSAKKKRPSREIEKLLYIEMQVGQKETTMPHFESLPGGKNLRCSACDEVVTGKRGRKDHERLHQGWRFVCTLCQRPYTSPSAARLHVFDIHHKCAFCGQDFTPPNEEALIRHYEETHSGGPFTAPMICLLCGVMCQNQGFLHKHRLEAHGTALEKEKADCLHPCLVCGTIMPSACALYNHTQQRHAVEVLANQAAIPKTVPSSIHDIHAQLEAVASVLEKKAQTDNQISSPDKPPKKRNRKKTDDLTSVPFSNILPLAYNEVKPKPVASILTDKETIEPNSDAGTSQLEPGDISTIEGSCLVVYEQGITPVDPTFTSLPNNRFQCDVCSQEVVGIQKKLTHRNFHIGCRYLCRHCNLEFVDPEHVEDHVSKGGCTAGSASIKCLLCEFSSHNKDVLLSHLEEYHAGQANPIGCHHCGLICKNGGCLQLHILQTHGSPEQKTAAANACVCPLCSTLLPMDSLFECHVFWKHIKMGCSNNTHYLCPFENCHQKWSKADPRPHFIMKHLSKHRQPVSVTRAFKCRRCQKGFLTRYDCERHERMVCTDERLFKCTWPNCGKAFKAKKTFDVHMRIHNDEKPLVCELCGYRCRQRSSMNWHLKATHKMDPTTFRKGGKGRPRSKSEPQDNGEGHSTQDGGDMSNTNSLGWNSYVVPMPPSSA